jgi:predicted membrane chloride channel (bestrophin family)
MIMNAERNSERQTSTPMTNKQTNRHELSSLDQAICVSYKPTLKQKSEQKIVLVCSGAAMLLKEKNQPTKTCLYLVCATQRTEHDCHLINPASARDAG